jgi:hypothetical protein
MKVPAGYNHILLQATRFSVYGFWLDRFTRELSNISSNDAEVYFSGNHLI